MDSDATQVRSAYGHLKQVQVVPASGVWSDPMPEDRQEQIAFFKREGFFILRNALSREELDQLDAEITRIARDYQSLPRIREGFDMEGQQDDTRTTPTFRKIGGIAELSEAFANLMNHPHIVAMLEVVMGPAIELYRDVVMMKPARVGREKPWHQDSVYWPWNPMDLVSAMTALDNATPHNGCLQVIARSHVKEVQHFGEELQIDIDEAQQAQTVYVPLNAGDTLLFHSLLLHASEPNSSDDDRRVCIFSYKTPGLKYIGKGAKPQAIKVRNVEPKGVL